MFTSFNGTQILLSIMIVLLGVTLVIIGVQLFFVLKDLRKSLERTNRILADVEQISGRAVTEQQYIDEILHGLRSMVVSVSSATTSVSSVTSRIAGPTSMGLAMFQAVSGMMQKQRQREEERLKHGRTS